MDERGVQALGEKRFEVGVAPLAGDVVGLADPRERGRGAGVQMQLDPGQRGEHRQIRLLGDVAEPYAADLHVGLPVAVPGSCLTRRCAGSAVRTLIRSIRAARGGNTRAGRSPVRVTPRRYVPDTGRDQQSWPGDAANENDSGTSARCGGRRDLGLRGRGARGGDGERGGRRSRTGGLAPGHGGAADRAAVGARGAGGRDPARAYAVSEAGAASESVQLPPEPPRRRAPDQWPAAPSAAPAPPTALPDAAAQLCALGERYGGWAPDSPESHICDRTYGE